MADVSTNSEAKRPMKTSMAERDPIETELFSIFTFYSLHGDATNPDHWRITMLIRFARDCQLLSPSFTGTQLELEVVRLGRKKRENMRRTMGEIIQGREFESSNTILITFADFLSILDMLAVKVYPNERTVQGAKRRLLLENVLLLSNRTIPRMGGNVIDADLSDEAAVNVIKGDFAKSLAKIFKYYIDLADKRRSQLLANEALQTGAVGLGNRQQTSSQKSMTQTTRERLRAQKDTISASEFVQFCQDYNLRSTNLLTSIQVGEAFFESVGYDYNTKLVAGMGFEQFCDCLFLMAVFAYRHAHATVTRQNKVKALLLFMWRASGATDKRAKAANAKGKVGQSHAGSLNMFGSGAFNDHFIRQWTAEGFPNYSSPVVKQMESGRSILDRLIATAAARGVTANSPRKAAKGATGTMNESDKAGEEAQEESLEGKKKDILYGFQIAALFRARPEIAEMCYLEMKAAKEAKKE